MTDSVDGIAACWKKLVLIETDMAADVGIEARQTWWQSVWVIKAGKENDARRISIHQNL